MKYQELLDNIDKHLEKISSELEQQQQVKKMKYEEAFQIAEETRALLAPHCYRCEIAGSIRRKKADNIKDIEIVAIPKPFEIGQLISGIAEVVDRWPMVKGKLKNDMRYTQRILPSGAKLDLFIANPINWGYLLAIRTGSARFSREVLATGWVKQGYKGVRGYLTKYGRIIPVREERELFKLIGIPYIDPTKREVVQ